MLACLHFGVGISEYVTGEIEALRRGIFHRGIAATNQELHRRRRLWCTSQEFYQFSCDRFVSLERTLQHWRREQDVHIRSELSVRAEDLVLHGHLTSKASIAFRTLETAAGRIDRAKKIGQLRKSLCLLQVGDSCKILSQIDVAKRAVFRRPGHFQAFVAHAALDGKTGLHGLSVREPSSPFFQKKQLDPGSGSGVY